MNDMENSENENIEIEKKIIVYLVILVVVLVYISIFFICDIISRGTINISDTTSIEYPNNSAQDDTDTRSNENLENSTNNNQDIRVYEDSSIKFFEDGKEWNSLKQLKIFDGSHRHVVEDKIAPGVQDTYTYTVECYGRAPMIYTTHFVEYNQYQINMVFKLKRNGKYVAGDDSTWVNAKQLDQYNVRIEGGTIDVYTLEWRWEDSSNDTEIGRTEGAKYSISLTSNAESIN